jgi:hypothetical protein
MLWHLYSCIVFDLTNPKRRDCEAIRSRKREAGRDLSLSHRCKASVNSDFQPSKSSLGTRQRSLSSRLAWKTFSIYQYRWEWHIAAFQRFSVVHLIWYRAQSRIELMRCRAVLYSIFFRSDLASIGCVTVSFKKTRYSHQHVQISFFTHVCHVPALTFCPTKRCNVVIALLGIIFRKRQRVFLKCPVANPPFPQFCQCFQVYRFWSLGEIFSADLSLTESADKA